MDHYYHRDYIFVENANIPDSHGMFFQKWNCTSLFFYEGNTLDIQFSDINKF